jgi:hypothetical protein
LAHPDLPGRARHVLYLKSEVTEDRWRIYSDNIAMARWLQSAVVGAISAELRDPAIPVADAQFNRSGNARDFWTERLDASDEQIALTWYKLSEPFLVHSQPKSVPGRPYGMCTVLIPALGARLTRNGIEAEGQPWPRDREGRLCAGIMRELDGSQIDNPGVVMSAVTATDDTLTAASQRRPITWMPYSAT